jgi:hypothetical protein
MPTIPTQQQIQDQVLATIRKGQEAALDGIRTWVETVQTITPKLPAIQVPLADRLPKPHDVVATAYDIAEAVLTSQRKFAEEVLKATAPLLPGDGQSNQEDAAA